MECKCGAYIDGHRRTCPNCGMLVNIDGVDPSVVSASSNPDAIKFNRAASRRNRAAMGEAGPTHQVPVAPKQPPSRITTQSAPATKLASKREKKPQKGMTRDSAGVYQPVIKTVGKDKPAVASKNGTKQDRKALGLNKDQSKIEGRTNAQSFSECWIECVVNARETLAYLVLVGHSSESGKTAILDKTDPFFLSQANGRSFGNARKLLTRLERKAESLGFQRVATGSGPDWYASRFKKK